MKINKNAFYAESHEWVTFEGNIATVGISDFAQNSLGDIVYVELPEIGAKMTKGADISTVESVKAVATVYSPVDGEVVEVNENLESSPESINEEPFDSWIAKLKVSSIDTTDLLDADAYSAFCEKEGH